MSAAPAWVALEHEATRRGMAPGYLRAQCKVLGVVLLGTRKRPLVNPAELDAAFDRARRAIAANDADYAEVEHARPPSIRVRG